MDSYKQFRAVPLRAVLAHFGFTEFRKRAGKDEFYGKCPLHNPTKNNTSFSFTDTVYNCFSCGAKGSGAIDLCMDLQKVGFKEAVELLKSVANELPASTALVGENKPFNGNYEKFYVPSPWLEARGIAQEVLDVYGVGQYNNPNRQSAYTGKIMLPILRFSDGAKVGYLARDISGQDGVPKYTFPKGFLKHLELFGGYQLKSVLEQSGQALLPVGFVVESPFAVMKLRSYGFLAVSPFGAYLSEEQASMVQALFRRVVYLPDRDKREQALSGVQTLLGQSWVKAPLLPEELDDPEYLSPEQLAHLAE